MSDERAERSGVGTSEWIVLGKPGKRFRIDAKVTIGTLRGIVRSREDDGTIHITFDHSVASVISYANRVGEVPVPPYIHGRIRRLDEYQTTYARRTGSVAAPTAGFHITPRIMRALRTKGVQIARVTLHVGLGTFQPIRVEYLKDHRMHAEWVEIPAATFRAIDRAHANGRHVIAIGTTTLRALEGAVHVLGAMGPSPSQQRGSGSGPPPPKRGGAGGGCAQCRGGRIIIGAWSGWVNLFITPGFRFRVVDALLTNFHLPKSSLLILVSAFAAPGDRSFRGRDKILRAYRHALHCKYRFYSFGDAVFII